jgi:membrane-associated protein
VRFFDANIYLFLLCIPFLGQLGIPLGSTFFIVYAGSMSNSISDLSVFFLFTLAAEIAGDFLGYFVGKYFHETRWMKKLLRRKNISYVYDKSEKFLKKRGAMSIFLSRFLVTFIGPYVNYVAGFQLYKFKKFTLFVILGEMVYCSELLLLGYFFKDTFEEIVDLFTSFSVLLLCGFVLYLIGKRVFRKRKVPLKQDED